MLLCGTITQRTRQKSLYMQGITEWTGLFFQDTELCNSLADVYWSENPVQVMQCEVCGVPGCNSSGYVNISNPGEYILWSPPTYDDPSKLANKERLLILNIRGSLLFPVSVWKAKSGADRWTFSPARRLDLMQSWLLEYYRLERINDWREMSSRISQRLIRGRNLGNLSILKNLEEIAAWFTSAPEEPLRGKLIRTARIPAEIEVLHLKDPDQDWPAFAIFGNQFYPTFGKDWMYLGQG